MSIEVEPMFYIMIEAMPVKHFIVFLIRLESVLSRRLMHNLLSCGNNTFAQLSTCRTTNKHGEHSNHLDGKGCTTYDQNDFNEQLQTEPHKNLVQKLIECKNENRKLLALIHTLEMKHFNGTEMTTEELEGTVGLKENSFESLERAILGKKFDEAFKRD